MHIIVCNKTVLISTLEILLLISGYSIHYGMYSARQQKSTNFLACEIDFYGQIDPGIVLRGAENVQKHPLLGFPTLFGVGHSLDPKMYYIICPI